MLPARRRALVVTAVAILVLAAGATLVVVRNMPRNCTMVGGFSSMAVAAAEPVRAELATVRVALRQGDQRRSVEFPPAATTKQGGYIERGVIIVDGSYRVGLDAALGGGWNVDRRATVTVTGLGRDGTVHFRHRETFTFDTHYPNGKGCGPEVLSHDTSLGEADRV